MPSQQFHALRKILPVPLRILSDLFAGLLLWTFAESPAITSP